ncbi:MAG: LacI family DNA-binding transcriptional regulator [Loktanella sp.]|nr:LacI family DNA-binding transcriptional regulator [Loktanella sp.]
MATIYDVARVAGVSAKTVSRVLNRDAPVKAATREKVEAAIAKLDFVPSTAARMMRSNRSGLIGLITGAISQTSDQPASHGLPDLVIVQAVQRGIASSGMTVMIADTGGQSDQVAPLVQTFLEHRVQGLIYAADFHQRVALPLVPKGFPLVLANCFDDAGTPAIVPDDRRGQHMLVERLIRAGHRRIGYLTLGRQMVATQLRTEGYRSALAEADIAFDPALVVLAYIDDAKLGSKLLWDAIDRLMSLPEPPTVLCCGNDAMAMRVYGILRSRGLQVPQDVSVAGFDDHRIIAETLYPPLTTVELPYAAIGARAAERLLSLIESGPEEGADAAPTRVAGPVAWRESVLSRTPVVDFKTQGRERP